jgi:hypothetical protein
MDSVECLSGLEYAERPLALTWNGKRYEVAEILSRSRAPDEKRFRVKTMDGQVFELIYREVPDEWKIEPL